MQTNEFIKVLSDPLQYQIGVLPPRTYKQTLNLQNESLYTSLNGEFLFNFVKDITKVNANFWEQTSNFATINVPSNIELEGFGQIQYVNTQYPWDGREDVTYTTTPIDTNYCGQYVKQFNWEPNGKSNYNLVFDGVESIFNVWLNGHYLGMYEDSFTRSEFDITNYLKNGTNVLAVEVYKYSVGSWLNDQDFWRLSGIFRDVGIIEITSNSIIDWTLNYQIDFSFQTVEIDITLETNSNFTTNLTILKNNQLVAKYNIDHKTHFKLENIDLWNPENPHLYQFNFNTPTEMFTHQVGFRQIEIIGNQLQLNQQKIIFKGVNRHEFNSECGRAISKEHILNDLENLKKINVNSIRTSHYPNQPYFYELCDQLGFLVIDEVNLETHGTWSIPDQSKVLPGANQLFEKRVLNRANNMYQRDKNFTSIIMWSLGNESFGGQTLMKMSDYFHQLDNSRPVHYEGVMWDRSFPDTSDIESQMYTTSENVEKFINENPQKPFILCEFSHSMGNSNGNFQDYMDLIVKYPNFHGGFIWEYNEQLIKRDGRYLYGGDCGDRPTDGQFICDGLVSDYCLDTPEKEYIKSMYSPLILKLENTTLHLTNNNMFKSLDLSVQTYNVNQDYEQLITTDLLTVNANTSCELQIELTKDLTMIRCYEEDNLLQTVSVNNGNPNFVNDAHVVKFVDGHLNFGMYSDDFEIIFCKNTNSLSSLKYNQLEVFANIDSSFTPNFYRGVTNNDKGAKIDYKLSVLKYLSYEFKSEITDYKYDNNQLFVTIKYQNSHITDYASYINYKISNTGEVDIQFTSENIPVKWLFNFGIKAQLNKQFTNYKYLGAGAIDTYVDRLENQPIGYYSREINHQCPYLVPQEYGNHCLVDVVQVLDENNNGFKILGNSFEFSLKPYSDIQLTNTRNSQDLQPEFPFLRLNLSQSGVGGDDSWGSWCKDRYITKTHNCQLFNIKIMPL